MKILLINYRYFISGGPEIYMFDLIDILEKNGHEVIPFSIKSNRNIKTKFEYYFAEPIGKQDEPYFDNMKKTPKMIFDVLSRLFYSFHVKNKLEKLIIKTQPDVVYILQHYNKFSPSIIDVCKQHNLPITMRLSNYFLICPQGDMINGNNQSCDECLKNGYTSCIKNKCIKQSTLGSILKTFALTLHRNVFKFYDKVDHFICTNDFMKIKMLEGGLPEKKLKVIPTFKNKETLEDTKICEQDEKYILYFGRFSHEKAIDTLIYAYLRSKLFEKNIKLYLIGRNAENISLKITQDENELLNKYCKIIDFLNKKELQKYIFNCLFVVHPSRCYENIPNSILEAFSFNKTVITTNIGSLPYLVKNGEVGYLYNYEDIEDLTLKMKQLSDDKIRTDMEKNIPPYFEQYNSNSHYHKLINIFEQKL